MHSALLKSKLGQSGQGLIGAVLGGVLIGLASLAILSGQTVFWRANQEASAEGGARSLDMLLMQLGMDNALCTRNISSRTLFNGTATNIDQLHFGSLSVPQAQGVPIYGLLIRSIKLGNAMPGSGGGSGGVPPLPPPFPGLNWVAGPQLAEIRIQAVTPLGVTPQRTYERSVIVPIIVAINNTTGVISSGPCLIPPPSGSSGGGGGQNVDIAQACAEIGGIWVDPAVDSRPIACRGTSPPAFCAGATIQNAGCDLVGGVCAALGAPVEQIHGPNTICSDGLSCGGGFSVFCDEDYVSRAILSPSIGDGGCPRDQFLKTIRTDGTLGCSARGVPISRAATCSGHCYRFNLVKGNCPTAKFDEFINGEYRGYVCNRPTGTLCGNGTCP